MEENPSPVIFSNINGLMDYKSNHCQGSRSNQEDAREKIAVVWPCHEERGGINL